MARASATSEATDRLSRAVAGTLQRYADRGVFRGFRASAGPRGVHRFEFLWLTRRPFVLLFSPARRVLVFAHLFPKADRVPGVTQAIREAVRSSSSPARPRHRRIDARRAKMACWFRNGEGSLRLSLASPERKASVAALQSALTFVNELFLVLHECFPEYLIGQFGVSPE